MHVWCMEWSWLPYFLMLLFVTAVSAYPHSFWHCAALCGDADVLCSIRFSTVQFWKRTDIKALFHLEIKHSDSSCSGTVAASWHYFYVSFPMFWYGKIKTRRIGGVWMVSILLISQHLRSFLKNDQACLCCKNALDCQDTGNRQPCLLKGMRYIRVWKKKKQIFFSVILVNAYSEMKNHVYKMSLFIVGPWFNSVNYGFSYWCIRTRIGFDGVCDLQLVWHLRP